MRPKNPWRHWAALGAALIFLAADEIVCASAPPAGPTVIVAVGAPGEEEFGKVFSESALAWQNAAATAQVRCVTIGLTNAAATNDLAALRAALEAEPKDGAAELWIVLLGHGTWDGREAKFNLNGPDLSAADLAAWLRDFHRPLAIINATASSAPFMKALAGPNRVIVTATKGGAEENYARFGKHISTCIADSAADLDKDGQTSLLEAFLMASRRVTEFYEREGRLATEHALLDDNGDGLGTPADWFRGIRVVKAPAEGAADGPRAHQWHLIRSTADQKLTVEQRQKRDALELEILSLRSQKATLKEDEYYARLESLLTQLGAIVLSNDQSGGTEVSKPGSR